MLNAILYPSPPSLSLSLSLSFLGGGDFQGSILGETRNLRGVLQMLNAKLSHSRSRSLSFSLAFALSLSLTHTLSLRHTGGSHRGSILGEPRNLRGGRGGGGAHGPGDTVGGVDPEPPTPSIRNMYSVTPKL